MKSPLKLIKSPYFQLIYYTAGFIAFVIILIFGNGLVWQTDQAELEKQKFVLEKEREITNLRNNIDNVINEIIDLNNEIYSKEKEGGLSEEEINFFKSRYDLLQDNLNHFKGVLHRLTKKTYIFKIPNPLKKYFHDRKVPPEPVKNFKIENKKRNFLFYTIQTNLITLIAFVSFLIFMTMFSTRLYFRSKIRHIIKTQQ